jgi:excisionase family DNA binding protein
MPKLLSVADVAEQCGVDPGKVLVWIHAGELVAVNIAKSKTTRPKWRIRETAVEEFLRDRETSRPTMAPIKARKVAAGVRSYY